MVVSDASDRGDGSWSFAVGQGNMFNWKQIRPSNDEPEVTGIDSQVKSSVDTFPQVDLTSYLGQGAIELDVLIQMSSNQNMTRSFVPAAIAAAVDVDCRVQATSTTTIHVPAVDKMGDQRVDIDRGEPTVQATASSSRGKSVNSIPSIGPLLEVTVADMLNGMTLEAEVADMVKELARMSLQADSELKDALNGHSRYVFPGGDTFAM